MYPLADLGFLAQSSPPGPIRHCPLRTAGLFGQGTAQSAYEAKARNPIICLAVGTVALVSFRGAALLRRSARLLGLVLPVRLSVEPDCGAGLRL